MTQSSASTQSYILLDNAKFRTGTKVVHCVWRGVAKVVGYQEGPPLKCDLIFEDGTPATLPESELQLKPD